MQAIKGLIDRHYQKDGIFSWILCFGAFLAYMVIAGIDGSFGVFIESIIQEFNATEYDAAWIASVHTSSQYFGATVSSALVKKFSFGVIISGGIITSCMASVMSMYCLSISGLTITHGLLCGTGLGILYGPLTIICTFYFESKLALATSLAYTGTGIGVFLISFLAKLIDMAYGWRGCMAMFASICPLMILWVVMVTILPNDDGNHTESEINSEQTSMLTTHNIANNQQVM